MSDVMEARHGIGHNMPPPDTDMPTPYEAARDKLDTAYGEARLWLDGAKVDCQELADGIGNLLGLIREADAMAKAAHKVEKQPWLDGGNEVQDRYNPLFERAKLASDACKKALAPWLAKLQADQDAKARAAREAAQAAERAAREAFQKAAFDDLAAREAAEKAIADAKAADKAATKAENARPQAGSMGKAIGLKTVHRAVLTDPTVAARHFWKTDPQAIQACLQTLADKRVRAGERAIPGFEIVEEKVAV